ncbi:MAG: hypothetical protein HYX24_04055 [Candidatus Aenigmarchaeota archaeon]|nr:hypothetical protein [Candidatus Aenigmarchaeota archaeon]
MPAYKTFKDIAHKFEDITEEIKYLFKLKEPKDKVADVWGHFGCDKGENALLVFTDNRIYAFPLPTHDGIPQNIFKILENSGLQYSKEARPYALTTYVDLKGHNALKGIENMANKIEKNVLEARGRVEDYQIEIDADYEERWAWDIYVLKCHEEAIRDHTIWQQIEAKKREIKDGILKEERERRASEEYMQKRFEDLI